MATETDPAKILMERSVKALEDWKCSTCGADTTEVASIDLYLLRDDQIVEHIRCKCGFDEHTAKTHLRMLLGK